MLISNEKIRNLLRSPIDLKPLHDGSENELITDDGEKFPVLNDIIYLLPEDERNADLGDESFYDSSPFGERNWASEEKIIAGAEKELKDLLSQYTKSSVIMDMGCGSGRLSNYLSLLEYENVASLDFSRQSLKQVRENSNNVCIWANNLHIPIESNSFDLVISTGVIHHTPDPKKAFEECVRVLKPGGRLYLKVYNKLSLYFFLFYSYGTLLRVLDSTKYTRFLADLFGLKLYKLARKYIMSIPNEEENILRAKVGNLFLKKMVYFFSTSEIEKLIKDNNLKIEESEKTGTTHRMHYYVAQKQT